MEAQQARFVSDLESEKGTRSRTNAELFKLLQRIDDRLRRAEILIATAAGAVALLKWFS